MKKLIALIVAISCGICVYAQHRSFSEAIANKKTGNEIFRVQPDDNNVLSPPFFSEDFASGIPPGWNNIDNSGNNVKWRTTATGAVSTGTPVDEQLNPAGTTAANGYLILDSDSAGPGITQNTDLTTTAINCSGHSVVHLTFNEYFAQFGASSGTVKVSNDNVSWVDVHHAETGLGQDSATDNPYSLDIDISATAANQSTVYIRFTYVGNYDYWWFVDDVALYEPTAADLAAHAIQDLNVEYTKIPFLQATSLSLSGEVKNVGINATSGGNALLELVDDGNGQPVFSENVPLSALAPGATQSVAAATAFAPPAAGIYKARITVALAGDGNAANDTILSDAMFISDSTYQRDDDVYAGVQGIGFGPGENGTAGHGFLVNTETDLTSVTFFLMDTFSFGASGTPLFFTVHPQLNSNTPPDGSTVLGISDTLMLFDGMIPPGGAFYTLHIQGGSLHLTPGLYFIGFHEADGLIPMGFSNNIFTGGAVWAFANSMGWFKPEDFGFFLSYMIRANFGMLPDKVGELLTPDKIHVYPNPSIGIFYLKSGYSGYEGTATVFDRMGKMIYNAGVDSRNETTLIDLSDYPAGIYYLHVRNRDFLSVSKISVSGK